MKLKHQTDKQLLDAGYHWKIAGYAKTSGFHLAKFKYMLALPIRPAPSSFHTPCVSLKFWVPNWLMVLIFRCLKVEWKVINRPSKFDVWLAVSSDGPTTPLTTAVVTNSENDI